MSWIAAAGLAVSGGISIAKGISQKNQAKKLGANNQFPEQQIPQAILDNNNMAKQLSSTGLAPTQYNNAKNDIQRNQASAISSATDRRSGLGLLGLIQQRSNDATNKLNVADANAVVQNRDRLTQSNNQLGQWQNNIWDWNKRQKYMQTAASVRALMGAGLQNENSGIDRLGSAAIFGATGLGNRTKQAKQTASDGAYGIDSKMSNFFATRPKINTGQGNYPQTDVDEFGNEIYLDPYTGEPIK